MRPPLHAAASRGRPSGLGAPHLGPPAQTRRGRRVPTRRDARKWSRDALVAVRVSTYRFRCPRPPLPSAPAFATLRAKLTGFDASPLWPYLAVVGGVLLLAQLASLLPARHAAQLDAQLARASS